MNNYITRSEALKLVGDDYWQHYSNFIRYVPGKGSIRYYLKADVLALKEMYRQKRACEKGYQEKQNA